MSSFRCCSASALRVSALASAFALNAAAIGAAAPAVRLHPPTLPNAVTITYATIDNPADPTFNVLLGINDVGTIVGNDGSGVAGHSNQAFATSPPYNKFASLNVPAAVTTRVTGIGDDGSISGFWSPTIGFAAANYGFVSWNEGSSGVFIDVGVNDPLASSVPPVNQILGFTSSVAIGNYNDANNVSHGYAFSVKAGTFTPVGIAGATTVTAAGMNEKGLLCGYYTQVNGQTLGFIEPLAGGTPIVVQIAGSTMTEFLGLSSYAAVGFYLGSNGVRHGLIYNLTTGVATTVDAPNGLKGTTLNGTNAKRQAVGYYKDSAGNTHGLLVGGF